MNKGGRGERSSIIKLMGRMMVWQISKINQCKVGYSLEE